MARCVKGNQASCIELLRVVPQCCDHRRADDSRYRARHAEQDNAWQTSPPPRQNSREVQILGQDHRLPGASVVEYRVVRIPDPADIAPVGGVNAVPDQIRNPPGREILVDDHIHDATT